MTLALTRRAFAITALGAGFAQSVLPVSAAVIATPADGLDVAEVKIPVADGAIPGYRARPAGGPIGTGGSVVHELRRCGSSWVSARLLR